MFISAKLSLERSLLDKNWAKTWGEQKELTSFNFTGRLPRLTTMLSLRTSAPRSVPASISSVSGLQI
jgi:hypothetical protein